MPKEPCLLKRAEAKEVRLRSTQEVLQRPAEAETVTGSNQPLWVGAEDRALWRVTIKAATGQFEEERKLAADTKRQRRKQADSQPQTPDQV